MLLEKTTVCKHAHQNQKANLGKRIPAYMFPKESVRSEIFLSNRPFCSYTLNSRVSFVSISLIYPVPGSLGNIKKVEQ